MRVDSIYDFFIIIDLGKGLRDWRYWSGKLTYLSGDVESISFALTLHKNKLMEIDKGLGPDYRQRSE